MAKKEDTRHLFKRGGVWWVQSNRHGERIVQTTGMRDLKAARAERDRILNPTGLKDQKDRAEAVLSRVQGIDQKLAKIADEAPATRIRNGWQAYLDQQNRPDSGPATLAQYEATFEEFAKWMADRHADTAELRHVTQTQADDYAGYLQKTVAAPTFNRKIAALALVWRVLSKTARIASNPWKQITRKRFAVHSRRELTLEELVKVCDAAKGEMRILLTLGIYCGLRLGDAALLNWSDVDMLKGAISVIPVKTARRTQKRVTLPIHRALFALLDETPAKDRQGYVLPGIAERYRQYSGAASKDVARLFESVGIVTSAKMDGAMRSRPDCGFHSLRHTFVSLCATGGVPQSVVQALVGHGSPAMTAHYTHIGLQTAQNAVASLPDVTGAAADPAAVEAAQGDLATVLALLERLDASGLKAAAAKVRELSRTQDGKGSGNRQAV